jgi:glycosyltransferase involved in cell wall biosynthesis
MIWRRDRAVAVFDEFPSTLEYPVARPALLLRDMGLDVHIIDLAADQRGRHYPGVTLWAERSHAAVARRLVHLRAGFAFLEGATWTLALLPLARRSWVRFTGTAGSPAKRAAQRYLLRRAAAVSFENPYEKGLFDIDPARQADLAYPVDIAFWAKRVERDPKFWQERRQPQPTGIVLTYVAQVMERKRQLPLVRDLLPLLLDTEDMTIVLAGYIVDESEAAAISKLARESGLQDRVLLLGGLSPKGVRQLYAWTAIHVINSSRETQCMALYESLAAGVPTLISDIPELTTAFPDLLRHRSPEQLRANVATLLDSPGVGQEQIDSCRPRLMWADVTAHDEAFARTTRRLLQ